MLYKNYGTDYAQRVIPGIGQEVLKGNRQFYFIFFSLLTEKLSLLNITLILLSLSVHK